MDTPNKKTPSSTLRRSNQRRGHIFDRQRNSVQLPRVGVVKRRRLHSSSSLRRKRTSNSSTSEVSSGRSNKETSSASNDLMFRLEQLLAEERTKSAQEQAADGEDGADTDGDNQADDDGEAHTGPQLPLDERQRITVEKHERDLAEIWNLLGRRGNSAASNQSTTSTGAPRITRDQLIQRESLDLYSGKTPFRKWWWRVEHLRDSYGWTEEETLRHAIARLTDDAINAYQSLGLNKPTTTLVEFQNKMESVCKQGAIDQTINSRIRHARIRDGQYVQEFSAYLQTLFNTLKQRPNEDTMLSALLDGVANKFDGTALRMARTSGSYANATRCLVEIEAYGEYSNSQAQDVEASANDDIGLQLHSQVNAQSCGSSHGSAFKDTSLFCVKLMCETNHTAHTCTLVFCNNHGWCNHSTSECDEVIEAQSTSDVDLQSNQDY